MGAIILLMSFLSGASGLVYEVLWSKRLALLFGSTALAQTVVLVFFLGGLSAGNAMLGKRADSSRSPWRFYAWLEAGIALLAALAPPLLRVLDGPGRWLAAAAVLAPAALMGGTIPALCVAAGGDLQRSVGGIYSANSAGAVAGCLLAAAWLIPAAGLDGAFWAAALVNALIASAAWNLRAPAIRPPGLPREAAKPELLPAALVYAVVFMSGFVALSYEIAWTRLLALTMGSSVYSFSEMLAGFILGISLGSFAAALPVLRRRDPAILLGLAEVGAGACVLLTLPFYGRLSYYFVLLRGHVGGGPWAFAHFEAMKFGLCLALMIVPTAFLGATLPLAARLAARPGETGEGVGRVFAWNTAGNVLGAVFGLLWLPVLGLEPLIRSGTTIHLAVAAAVLWLALPWTARRRFAAGALAAALLVVYRARMPRWDLRVMTQGVFRGKVEHPPERFAAFKALFDEVAVLFYRDDREATVTVLRYATGEVSLKVNGKTDASTGSDMRTQILLGELPLILKPRAKSALLIGWGSGVTAGSILRHRVERLDAVELIPAVVEASRLFRAESRNPIDDPRLRLSIEDAKTFLRRPGNGYDVVVSEPSNPWMEGVGSLFSQEFYRRARARLRPGGLVVQWFHAYEMNDPLFQAALRTFRSSFPHITLWNIADSDLLLVGSDAPIAPDFNEMEREFLAPAVWADLRRADVTYLSTLLGVEAASDRTVKAMEGTGPLNAELRPLLEYGAPKAYFRGERVHLIDSFDDRLSPETEDRLLLAAYLKSRGRPLDNHEYMDRMLFPHSVNEESILRRMIAQWKRRYTGDSKADFALNLLNKYMEYWNAEYKTSRRSE